MTNSRALTLGLLASTALAGPALAQPGQSPAPGTNATDVTSPPPKVQQAQEGNVPDQTEIVITATKREERLQNVPQSVIAIGTRRLDQLNISNFEQYTKQLPSVSYNFSQSGGTVVYMRGVATGGDGNHSGALPSVGVYLDEQPVTTIGGALDVHIYDIARIESLAGPQGTLYGASSEAGTIRIITNKPDLNATYGRVDGELNMVDHGGVGGKLEGMINVPLASHIAFRGVAFYQRDAGFIDNVLDSRTYCGTPITDGEEITGCIHDGIHVTNAAFVRDDINSVTKYGGRAALKIDLDDNWTITPTVMHQYYKQDGFFAFDPLLGDLNDSRFRDEYRREHFTQAALTVEGKIWNFDVTYAGAYLDHPTYSLGDYTDYTDHYDAYYEPYGGLANAQHYVDANGNTIDPRQYIVGGEHFKKLSQELRIATPKDAPLRAIVGAFYQRQTDHIYQNYLVDNLGPQRSVNGWPGTIWLTLQDRTDRDYALFGEAEYDVTPKITLIAGGRYYKFDNTIIGFNGMGQNNPGNFTLGYNRCLTVNGLELRADPSSALIAGGVPGTPCTNVGQVVGGKLEPKRSEGTGFTYRLSARFKPTKDLMFYATWSKGFRPGGINRQPTAPAYNPDYLYNLEAGWKTQFGPLIWNGAIYHQIWKGFQFAFLGPNSLTVIQNGRDARINGLESDVSYVAGGLTLNAAVSYTDAKTKGAICQASFDPAPNCDTFYPAPDPDDDFQDFIITPSGTRLPITPIFKGTATARYTWPVGSGKAHVQGSVSHQSSSGVDVRQNTTGDPLDPGNPNDLFGRVKGSTLVDLFVGYDWRSYNFELFATNVFDERNQLARITACGACDRVHIIPGRPRTIGVRLGAKF
jgi:outer membrane receptor protein involved in Fe transport